MGCTHINARVAVMIETLVSLGAKVGIHIVSQMTYSKVGITLENMLFKYKQTSNFCVLFRSDGQLATSSQLKMKLQLLLQKKAFQSTHGEVKRKKISGGV